MGSFRRSPVSGAAKAAVFAAGMLLLPASAIADPIYQTEQPSAAEPSQVSDVDAARDTDREAMPGVTVGDSRRDAEVDCLARNIYWEAGGEPEIGKIAVAAVTLNRVNDGRFPKNVCGVVEQGSRGSGRCQFTWACDGRRHVAPRGSRWQEALAIAHQVLHLGYDDPTNGALFFHGISERTRWTHIRSMVAEIGNHMFYR